MVISITGSPPRASARASGTAFLASSIFSTGITGWPFSNASSLSVLDDMGRLSVCVWRACLARTSRTVPRRPRMRSLQPCRDGARRWRMNSSAVTHDITIAALYRFCRLDGAGAAAQAACRLLLRPFDQRHAADRPGGHQRHRCRLAGGDRRADRASRGDPRHGRPRGQVQHGRSDAVPSHEGAAEAGDRDDGRRRRRSAASDAGAYVEAADWNASSPIPIRW